MNNEEFITFALQNMGKHFLVKRNVPFVLNGEDLPYFYFSKGEQYILDGFLVTSSEQTLLIRNTRDSEDSISLDEFSNVFGEAA